jgi:hypothetical protein
VGVTLVIFVPGCAEKFADAGPKRGSTRVGFPSHSSSLAFVKATGHVAERSKETCFGNSGPCREQDTAQEAFGIAVQEAEPEFSGNVKWQIEIVLGLEW